MRNVSQDQQELNKHWQQRVRHARAVYLYARAQHALMVEESGRGTIAPADGSFAVAAARRAKAWALHELRRTMQVYANLVFKGVAPPPDEDEQLLT
jgi:hypothetical protein